MRCLFIQSILILLLLPSLLFSEPKVAKLGIIAPLTLGNADAGQDIMRTLNLFNDNLKHSGDVSFDLVFEDGKCGVGNAPTRAVHKLINIDKVDYLIAACSGTTSQIAPIASRHKIPVIAIYSSHRDVRTLGAYVFRTFIDIEKGIQNIISLMIKENPRIGIISEENRFTDGHFDILKENLGNHLVYSQTFQPESTDFRAILTLAKTKDIDAFYFNSASPKTLTSLVMQAKQLGIGQPIYTNMFASNREFLESTEPHSEGIQYLDVPSIDKKTTHFDTFYKAYLEKYNQLQYEFLIAVV